MENNNAKQQKDVKLWLLVLLSSAVLIGIGLIVAALGGNSIGDMFGFSADDPSYETTFIVSIVAAVIFIVGGVTGIYLYNKKHPAETKSTWNMKTLMVGALCLGLSFVLSYISIWKMPMGGSITPASMLPIMLFAYIYGTPKGLIVGVAYGLLQMIQDPWLVNFWQVMLDYILAFGALSLAGLFRKNMVPGIIAGGLGRFLFAFLAGIIFWGEYAPAGTPIWLYSLGYQATYILPEMAICIVIVLIPAIRRTIEALKTQALSTRR